MPVPLVNTTQNSLPSIVHPLVNNGYMDPVWYRFFYAFLGQLLSTNVLINSNNLSDVENELTAFNNLSPLLAPGDMLYFDGVNNTRLASNITATRYLANTGTLNEPNWDTVNLANGVSGNLDVSHQNSGTNANATSFWCGNGTWVSPPIGIGGMQVFTSSGTFSIPAGTAKVLLKLWGAGGGGGGGNTTTAGGGGGGAGGYTEYLLTIPGGTTILTITVGTAGTGGANGSGGLDGSATSVSGTGFSTITAAPGLAGSTGSGTGNGGLGGLINTGTFNIPGGNGLHAQSISLGTGGCAFGTPVNATPQAFNDGTTKFPGNGGNGGQLVGGAGTTAGNDGAGGCVYISW